MAFILQYKVCCVCVRYISADFGKSISKVWKLIKYEEKWRENREKNVFVIRRNKAKKCNIDLQYNIWRLVSKNK